MMNAYCGLGRHALPVKQCVTSDHQSFEPAARMSKEVHQWRGRGGLSGKTHLGAITAELLRQRTGDGGPGTSSCAW